jgi:hypothetical protein
MVKNMDGGRAKMQGWQDPGSASKDVNIYNPKNGYWALNNKIRDVHPGSRILALDFPIPNPGFRGQKSTRSAIL